MLRCKKFTQYTRATCGSRARNLCYIYPSCSHMRSMLHHTTSCNSRFPHRILIHNGSAGMDQILAPYRTDANQEEGKGSGSSYRETNVILSHSWSLALCIGANKWAASKSSKEVFICHIY